MNEWRERGREEEKNGGREGGMGEKRNSEGEKK